MIDYMEILRNSPLFRDMPNKDISSLLACLDAKEKIYPKNSSIFSIGDPVKELGILLFGSVTVQKEDFWGNRSILEKITTSGLFAESFASVQTKEIPINVVSTEKTKILWIHFNRIITPCTSSCDFHRKLIENMLQILANKNILLTEKIQHTACRTTKGKLLSYLSAQALQKKSNRFSIPFNRQELADYLSVDRSAMSKTLCELRDDEILSFQKNIFTLHQNEL